MREGERGERELEVERERELRSGRWREKVNIYLTTSLHIKFMGKRKEENFEPSMKDMLI